jgi:hypothetical protein
MEAGFWCIPDSNLAGQLNVTDRPFNLAKEPSLTW